MNTLLVRSDFTSQTKSSSSKTLLMFTTSFSDPSLSSKEICPAAGSAGFSKQLLLRIRQRPLTGRDVGYTCSENIDFPLTTNCK